MDEAAPQVLASVHHLRFLIFDWSLPNIIMGVIVILLFFGAAWARLPKWIERGRERAATGVQKKGGRK
jgi:protein-S-isoprenylcysteine O-methyltransferase Ste14